MNEDHGQDIDELLSAYIDGQLVDRSQNELRRLIRHDKEVAARLLQLQKQTSLLNCIPSVGAPSGLTRDIQTAIERKLILDDFPKTDRTVAGLTQLFAREMLATAAMIILPLGILGFVLYQIVAPSPKTYKFNDIAQNDSRAPEVEPAVPIDSAPTNNVAVAGARELFAAELVFQTDDPILVNDYLYKAIFDNKLLPYPQRSNTVSVYRINCSSKRLAALFRDMSVIWPRCRSASLTVQGREITSAVVIDNVSCKQALAILDEDTTTDRIETARNFARYNDIIRSLAYPRIDIELSSEIAAMMPIEPILTGVEENTTGQTNPEKPEKIDARLVITIQSR